MFGSGGKGKIKVDDTVLRKVRVAASLLGCSEDEFIARALEEKADQVVGQSGSKQPTQAEVDEIAQQLKGLGYLE
jgi:methylmalonyl-CoA mutase cobalamin-binding subunit